MYNYYQLHWQFEKFIGFDKHNSDLIICQTFGQKVNSSDDWNYKFIILNKK